MLSGPTHKCNAMMAVFTARVLTTECGEVIYLKGSGSAPGKEADGGVIFKTINHHHTASEKFKHLNGVAGVGIYNVSPEGKTTAQFSIL